MPVCIKCIQDKDATEFALKSKTTGRRNTTCKKCHSVYVKQHYVNNKKNYIESSKRNRSSSRRTRCNYINTFKTNGCIVCEETFAPALDFHHVSEKKDQVSRLHAKDKIQSEIEKCIVLCATCHRKYHYGHLSTQSFVDDYISKITNTPR